MKNTSYKLILILIIPLILNSCVTQQKTQTGSVISAAKYNPSRYVLHPKFKVFHETDSFTKLYLKLYTRELRFSSANEQRINKALITLEYKIKEAINSNEVIDSSKTSITIKKAEKQTSIVSFFKIKDFGYDQYIIELKIIDVFSNKRSLSYIYVNKANDDNQQYYLSLHKKSLKPEFNEYLKKSDTLLIKHNNKDIKKLYVSYFKSNFAPAKKPDVPYDENLNLKIDTGWNLKLNNDKFEFNAKKPGIYIIRADSTKIKGMMKVIFKNEYPIVSRSYQMVNTLSYLLSEEEFIKMKSSENMKLSVDNFWLNATKNKERASEILKIWYNRANYSNYYFSSYKEGWKTDRGMVYMVFGPPDDIKPFNDAEKWIYINKAEGKKVEFNFIKQNNSLSKNDYVLMRSRKYETDWSKAKKSWRSGNVYRF